MPKKADRIITSVYLTKEMCGQIDKLATGSISPATNKYGGL